MALGEQVLDIGWKEDVVVELQKSFDTLRRRKRLRTGSRVEIREGKQERQSHSPDQLACKVRGKHSFLVVFFFWDCGVGFTLAKWFFSFSCLKILKSSIVGIVEDQKAICVLEYTCKKCYHFRWWPPHIG